MNKNAFALILCVALLLTLVAVAPQDNAEANAFVYGISRFGLAKSYLKV